MKKYKLLFLLVIVIFAVSCAKPPVKTYNDAQTALKTAQDAEAEKCAPEEYQNANKLLKDAEAKMDEGKDDSSKYDEAKQLLLNVKERAAEAEKVAKERRAESNQINTKLEELKKEIDTN